MIATKIEELCNIEEQLAIQIKAYTEEILDLREIAGEVELELALVHEATRLNKVTEYSKIRRLIKKSLKLQEEQNLAIASAEKEIEVELDKFNYQAPEMYRKPIL
ncbi:MAG: hypothetical protein KAG61_05445 [Bacteriovoracaceae bacterium]|nr:hypothetical protein [Bacteriovoracaceae bacterium]